MRSLLMVGALCAVVMMLTGCCSSNCRSGSLLGNRHLAGETCSEGCSAEAPAISSDCGCSDCAALPLAKGHLSQTRQASLHKRLSRVENRSNGDGLLNRLDSSNQEFSTADIATETLLQGEILPVGGQVLGDRVAQAGGVIGCGRLGCGSRGHLCRSCNARARLAGLHGGLHGGGGLTGNGRHTKPYGGTIPHTATPPTFNGGPGGGGVPQYVYPYYTTRGPRDFLNTNPPSIGP